LDQAHSALGRPAGNTMESHMNTPLPRHLAAGISQRIAWLREAWQINAICTTPRLSGYRTTHRRFEPAGRGAKVPGSPWATPTFPQPHSNDARSRS
jgi:hypothetical protein